MAESQQMLYAAIAGLGIVVHQQIQSELMRHIVIKPADQHQRRLVRLHFAGEPQGVRAAHHDAETIGGQFLRIDHGGILTAQENKLASQLAQTALKLEENLEPEIPVWKDIRKKHLDFAGVLPLTARLDRKRFGDEGADARTAHQKSLLHQNADPLFHRRRTEFENLHQLARNRNPLPQRNPSGQNQPANLARQLHVIRQVVALLDPDAFPVHNPVPPCCNVSFVHR